MLSVDLLFCSKVDRPKFGSVCWAWHLSEIKFTSSNNKKPSVGASRKTEVQAAEFQGEREVYIISGRKKHTVIPKKTEKKS